ncbi:MAG: hypothetical protein NWF07_08270, partial [Candidatus Bathyarchaeota archaeon]|nr:hypothetical protein [Candidatus Bathyarchaeota archaeon]
MELSGDNWIQFCSDLQRIVGPSAYPTNAAASPGLIYGNENQGDRFLADLLMSEYYIQRSLDVSSLLLEYPHLLYTPIKNKDEVNVTHKPGTKLTYYMQKGAKKNLNLPIVKSRNYYPLDTAGQQPAKVIHKLVNQNPTLAYDATELGKPVNDRSLNLLGCKIFKGGVNDMM